MRQIYGWFLLAAFAAIMFNTLLFWWLQYHKILILEGVIVAAGEPNTLVLVAELITLPAIAVWALVEIFLVIRRITTR